MWLEVRSQVVDHMSLIFLAKNVANESAVSCVVGVVDF